MTYRLTAMLRTEASSTDVSDRWFDAVMDALLEAPVLDPDLGGSLTSGTFEVGMLVEADEVAEAALLGMSALTGALQAAAMPGIRIVELRTTIADSVVAVA